MWPQRLKETKAWGSEPTWEGAPGLSSGPVVYRCHVSQPHCQNTELNPFQPRRDGRTRARVQNCTVKADLTGVTPYGSILPASLISKALEAATSASSALRGPSHRSVWLPARGRPSPAQCAASPHGNGTNRAADLLGAAAKRLKGGGRGRLTSEGKQARQRSQAAGQAPARVLLRSAVGAWERFACSRRKEKELSFPKRFMSGPNSVF